jgi:soluble lytic murein transglycosylase-like protein
MPLQFKSRLLSLALLSTGLSVTMTSGFVKAQEPNLDVITTSSINPARFGASDNCTKTDTAKVAALVRVIATELDFDPDLAEAVAFVESGLGQNQTSGAGAVGIMQLMPGTASDLGVTDRCDAASNIRGGITYLKTLYDEFKDPLLMLAAYNAGAGRVYEKNGIPEFEETAKYVVKVMNRWKLAAKVKSSGLPQETQTTAIMSLNPDKPEASSDAPAGTSLWRDNHVIEVQ